MNLILTLIGVIIIVGVSFQNWRMSVKATFVIVILEGVLRKWVLPQASDMIYFLKDLVLLGAYARFYMGSEPKYHCKSTIFTTTLFMVIVWCVSQVFNPSLGSPIVGWFGIKAYLFYIPLMWMLPSLFQSQEELYQFLSNYLLLVIPVSILAIAQFFSPVNSLINVYGGGVLAKAVVDGNARVTGTFPYISGFSTYLSFCFSLLIPLLSLRQTKTWQIITFAEALLVVGTSFMTGARGLLLFEILFLLGYFCLLWLTKPSTALRSTQKFILPVVLISAVVPIFFSRAIEAFFKRANNSDSFNDRVFSAFSEPELAMQFKGFDSYGIGATHQAVPSLRNALQLSLGEVTPPAEGEMGKIVLEIGPFGFFLWYGLRSILIVSLLRVFLKLKTPFLRDLALAAFLFHIINFTSQMVFNNTLAIYYWLFSGFIFLLPELEYRQLLFYRQQEKQSYV